MKQALDELMSRKLNWTETNGHYTAGFTIPGKVKNGVLSVSHAGFASMHIIEVSIGGGQDKEIGKHNGEASEAIALAEQLLFADFPDAKPN